MGGLGSDGGGQSSRPSPRSVNETVPSARPTSATGQRRTRDSRHFRAGTDVPADPGPVQVPYPHHGPDVVITDETGCHDLRPGKVENNGAGLRQETRRAGAESNQYAVMG